MSDGWVTKSLEELCDFKNGLWKGKKPPYVEVGIIRNTNFSREGFLDDSDIAYHNVEVKQLEKRKLQFGDIILEKSGGGPKQPVGRVIPFELRDGEFSFSNFTSVIRIKDKEELNFRFLHRLLFYYYVAGVTESMQRRSTGIRNLDFKIYKQLRVPLPSPAEQKRIVAILDETFSAIAKAKENAEKNLANARELFESYLNRVFTQQGDGWEETQLGEVVTFQGGSQPPKSVFVKEKKPGYIRLIQIRDYKSDKHIVFIPEKVARRKCDASDVMIGRYGPPLFQILRGIDGAYNVALMKVIPDETRISKDYLFHFLKNGRILSYVIHSSNRAAGQAGVNKKTLEPYPIPFPTDLSEQTRIVGELEGLMADTKRLESIYEQKLANLDELKQSLLQKAFTGQLTAKTAELEMAV